MILSKVSIYCFNVIRELYREKKVGNPAFWSFRQCGFFKNRLSANPILFASRYMILLSKQRSCTRTVLCHLGIIVIGMMMFTKMCLPVISIMDIWLCQKHAIPVLLLLESDFVNNLSFRYVLYPEWCFCQ
jgi:hypothetical protein